MRGRTSVHFAGGEVGLDASVPSETARETGSASRCGGGGSLHR